MARIELQTSLAALCAIAAGAVGAQGANIKPPQAQAWIDVATFSGIGMPAMSGAGATLPREPLGRLPMFTRQPHQGAPP